MTWKGFKDIQAKIEVDVTPSEEEILSKVNRSRRKNVNKAIRENLIAIEGKTNEEWNQWYEIYKKVCKEGGIEHDSLETYKIPASTLMLIKKDDKILGGGVFTETDDKLVWKAYASLIEFQELRVNDFLYWSGFVWAKKRGKKKVDLGGWQIKARGHLNGINNFKEQWGGEIIYYNIYSKSPLYILGRKAIRNSATTRWIWDRIKRRPKSKKN